MPRTDAHLPLNWRAVCPSPYTPAEDRWPPCGLDCEGRAQCERERAEADARAEAEGDE